MEATRFATLHKLDYNHTIGLETKRKLIENVTLLRRFKIFSKRHLRENVLEKIFRYMVPKTFARGNLVYKEGVSPVDGVYFIKSGDFEVTQQVGTKDSKLERAKFAAAKRALSKQTRSGQVESPLEPSRG